MGVPLKDNLKTGALMTAKRFFAHIILLVIVAAVVFFVGCVTLLVKPGFCGIMTSKTSGIYPKPIVSGTIDWCWERLLPTNTRIAVFPLAPYTSEQTLEGMLPSGALYATYTEPQADFSYRITMRITLALTPEGLLELSEANVLASPESLEPYFEQCAKQFAQAAAEYLLKYTTGTQQAAPVALLNSQIQEIYANCKQELSPATVQSVDIVQAHIPDRELYNRAKAAFTLYQEELDAALKVKAEQQATVIAEANAQMGQLERFADLLERYPQFNELSRSGNLKEILNEFKITQ